MYGKYRSASLWTRHLSESYEFVLLRSALKAHFYVSLGLIRANSLLDHLRVNTSAFAKARRFSLLGINEVKPVFPRDDHECQADGDLL